MINVSNIEELYSAVNDSVNDGTTIILAAGTYKLSANTPDGAPRPNGGRLELRLNMSLIGKKGDLAAVKIDASLLPQASLLVPFSPPVPSPNRTGPIRMGRGKNSVEWLTIIGHPQAAAGIETDLGDTTPTKIRVAHVVSGGSSRGLDVRNVGSAMAGRKLEAEIEENDFSSGANAGTNRQAIRLTNFVGATGGEVHAKMSGNRFHSSPVGCFAVNNQTNSGVVNVRSNGDKFENNELGCRIFGVHADSVAGTGASTTFEAHGGQFINNSDHGIEAVGGEAGALTNVAFNNTVLVRLFGSKASGNQNGDFRAFGAKSTGGIAGTNNKVTIERHGVSTQIKVDRTDSKPPEPARTNTVIVIP